jgi:hypothetical protein
VREAEEVAHFMRHDAPDFLRRKARADHA